MALIKIHTQGLNYGGLRLDRVEIEGDLGNPYFFLDQYCKSIGLAGMEESIEENHSSILSGNCRVIDTYVEDEGGYRKRAVLPAKLIEGRS